MKKTTRIENWLDVKGTDGVYQVSDLGNVRSVPRVIQAKRSGKEVDCTLKGYLLKPTYDKDGYKKIVLTMADGTRKSFQVHRLVMMTFKPIDGYEDLEVNHLGAKDDNRIEQLEWCTRAENRRHAMENGLILSGENHPRCILTDEQCAYIREVYTPRCSEFGAEPLSKLFKVSASWISAIGNGTARNQAI